MRISNLERNNLIYSLYFKDKLNITQISKTVNLSISQVSRVLSKSNLYMQEKAERKEENRKKHSEQTKEIMKKKRNRKSAEEKAIMEMLHNQASIELSYSHPISKVSIRKNCSSAYEYNFRKQRFELKNDMAYSKDMPSKIKY